VPPVDPPRAGPRAGLLLAPGRAGAWAGSSRGGAGSLAGSQWAYRRTGRTGPVRAIASRRRPVWFGAARHPRKGWPTRGASGCRSARRLARGPPRRPRPWRWRSPARTATLPGQPALAPAQGRPRHRRQGPHPGHGHPQGAGGDRPGRAARTLDGCPRWDLALIRYGNGTQVCLRRAASTACRLLVVQRAWAGDEAVSVAIGHRGKGCAR
jgi:hypothetical protein